MISIVIPVYNEESNLEQLFTVLMEEMKEVEHEVIFVNDGSTDNSLRVIENLIIQDKKIVCIDFSRNFGQQAAILAGLQHAKGKACLVMDADLQDNPKVLSQFIQQWEAGYEVVYAIKNKRNETFLKLLLRNLFYKIIVTASEVHIPSGGGAFCLLDRKVVDSLLALEEKNLFFPGMRSWVGFKQIGVSVEQNPRYAGQPSVSVQKHFKLAFDAIFSFSYAPLRLILIIGWGIFVFSIFFMLYILFQKYFTDKAVPGFTTLAILLSMLGSMNLIAISILGEYILRIYNETKKRPLFIIRSILTQQKHN